jgi:hypothetical protein
MSSNMQLVAQGAQLILLLGHFEPLQVTIFIESGLIGFIHYLQ